MPAFSPVTEFFINEFIVTTAQATMDLSNIPSGFRSLRAVVRARSSEAVADRQHFIRINNDSGNNYNYVITRLSSAAAVAVLEGVAQAQFSIGTIPGTTGVANTFSEHIIEIFRPTRRNGFLVINVHGGNFRATTPAGQMMVEDGFGNWASQVDVNRITVMMTAAFNFIVGSSITLYGRI